MREWILGIFAASLLTSIAVIITPKNKRAVTLAGGLIMILAAVKPLAQLSYQDMAQQISKYSLKADELRTGIDVGSAEIMALIIQEQTEAYILDKAVELGLDAEISVETKRASDGWPYPESVSVSGRFSENQKQQLSKYISSELGIPADRQEWS